MPISLSQIWPALKAVIQLRMLGWLLAGACFLSASVYLAYQQGWPQLQMLCWHIGKATVAAALGYWLDRGLSRDRITPDSPWYAHLRRAIISAACILGVLLAV